MNCLVADPTTPSRCIRACTTAPDLSSSASCSPSLRSSPLQCKRAPSRRLLARPRTSTASAASRNASISSPRASRRLTGRDLLRQPTVTDEALLEPRSEHRTAARRSSLPDGTRRNRAGQSSTRRESGPRTHASLSRPPRLVSGCSALAHSGGSVCSESYQFVLLVPLPSPVSHSDLRPAPHPWTRSRHGPEGPNRHAGGLGVGVGYPGPRSDELQHRLHQPARQLSAPGRMDAGRLERRCVFSGRRRRRKGLIVRGAGTAYTNVPQANVTVAFNGSQVYVRPDSLVPA